MRTIFRNNYTPVMGEYHERYVIDEARHKAYLFDCDGVFYEMPDVYVVNEKGTSEEYAVSQKLFTDEVTRLDDDIDYEAAARAAADTELGDAIDAAERAIGEEATAREGADTDLQNQIDTIKASSDVVDIVGTYAELQDYDTTKLNNNDIIKVLEDETHDGDITYYRWSTSTESFTFVGSLAAYYSKGETDTLLSGKQDTLTAGSNIQINGTTISATDTTYSAFTGATSQDAGTSGLVPAPAIGDATKYLSGDGTWKTIDTSSVTVFYNNYDSTDGTLYSDSAMTTAVKGVTVEAAFNRGKVIVCYKRSEGNKCVEVTSIEYFRWVPEFLYVEMAMASDAYFTNCFFYSDKYTTTCSRITKNFQQPLIAGANISIISGPYGPTISATDTTYSAFTGATSSVAGSTGLVPAPTTSDPDKFLKGDGTWGTAVTNALLIKEWS